jgi:hypothetical protein
MRTSHARGCGEFWCFAARTFSGENPKITKHFQEPVDFLQFEGIRQLEEHFTIGKLAGEIGKRDAACVLGFIPLVNFGDSCDRDRIVRLIRSF